MSTAIEGFGLNSMSSYDLVLIKSDDIMNIQWIIAIDIGSGTDLATNMILDTNDKMYIASTVNMQYPWITIISQETGSLVLLIKLNKLI